MKLIFNLSICALSLLTLFFPTSASPLAEPEVVPRAIHRQSCAGDYGGNSIGVLACCDVDFISNSRIDIVLSVRDSKGDSHSVSGWCIIQDSNGKKYNVPSSALVNNGGVGSTLSKAYPYSLSTSRILYVSARGCVVGGNCVGGNGNYVTNPY